VLILSAGILAMATGCGGSSEPAAAPAAEEAATAFRSWLTQTDNVIADFDRKGINAAEVHLLPAPPKTELRLLSASHQAFPVALNAQLSEIKLQVMTTLRDENVKAGYCFLFSVYVEHGAIPTPERLELDLYRYVIGRALPPPPLKQLEGTVKLFRNSIIQAHSSPQAVANLAMATVCSR
jgi:hypothetical protein